MIVSIIITLLSLVVKSRAEEGIKRLGSAHRQLEAVNNPAVITVVDSQTDLTELCYAFQTLSNAKGYPDAPILIFTGTNLLDGQIRALDQCSQRRKEFIDIMEFYTTFPDNFEKIDGVDYDFQQRQRFLVTFVFDHASVAPYDILMRVSHSTCLTIPNTNLPFFSNGNTSLDYQSQFVPGTYEIARKYTAGLYEASFDFLSQEHVAPSNIQEWADIVKIKDGYNTLPLFNADGLEIIRKAYMQQDIVRRYHRYITEEHSSGFYDHKWSVNNIRYLSTALFGEEGRVSNSHARGFVEKNFFNGNLHPKICRSNEDLIL